MAGKAEAVCNQSAGKADGFSISSLCSYLEEEEVKFLRICFGVRYKVRLLLALAVGFIITLRVS